MDNLAYYNHRAGRFEDAARLGEQMVDLSRKVLGTTNNVTIHRTGQLAEYCRSVGKYERAIQLRRDVLSARRSISGRDHDDTVADIKSLADTYAHQGRWIEARNVLMELGAIENLPDSSPLALMALATLDAYLGERAAYETHCQLMLTRFGASTNAEIADRCAKPCLLLPLDGSNRAGAIALAEQLLRWVKLPRFSDGTCLFILLLVFAPEIGKAQLPALSGPSTVLPNRIFHTS